MVFKNIIRTDIEDHFYISEITDDKNQVVTINYLDINHDYTLEEIENHKKGIMRGLRLSKIMGEYTEDLSRKLAMIKEIKDPKILPKYLKDNEDNALHSFLSPTVRKFNIFLTKKIVIEKELSNNFDHNKNIYTEVYNKINSIIEEVLVKEYLYLSYLNNIKIKYFLDTKPIICDDDPNVILSKINLAFNYIFNNNKKEMGNMLIMNPNLYNRFKNHFLKLNIRIFLSDYIGDDKIIATLNSKGIEFFRMIYSFKEVEVADPTSFGRIKKFRLDYGYERTSISPEDNCILIDIRG